MKNKLGFQLYSLKEYEGGWDDALEAVKNMGIDYIEPWCGAVPDKPDAQMSISSLCSTLDRLDMKFTCGHISIDEFDNRYETWKKLLLDYGSRFWVIPFAKSETLEQWLALLPKFRQMQERMKEDGLTLAYHNHHMELEVMGGKYIMEHLLDGMPELYAQFHIGQFKPSRGISLPDWLRKYQGRVCSLHVNDSDDSGSVRLGKGLCKAEESIRTALDTGVDTFIIEIDLTKATSDDVRRDAEFARKLIA